MQILLEDENDIFSLCIYRAISDVFSEEKDTISLITLSTKALLHYIYLFENDGWSNKNLIGPFERICPQINHIISSTLKSSSELNLENLYHIINLISKNLITISDSIQSLILSFRQSTIDFIKLHELNIFKLNGDTKFKFHFPIINWHNFTNADPIQIKLIQKDMIKISDFIDEKILNLIQQWNKRPKSHCDCGLCHMNLKNKSIKPFEHPSTSNDIETESTENITTPYIEWPHKQEAHDTYLYKGIEKKEFYNNRKGILEMATFTGKTSTAIKILKNLKISKKIDCFIIIAKGNPLLDQWSYELLKEDIHTSKLYEKWNDLDHFFNRIRPVLLTSYHQFSKVIQSNFKNWSKTLLIFDEVHNLATKNLISQLNSKKLQLDWTIGLSATPERKFDPDGNKFIEQIVGKSIFEFGLKEAINAGILKQLNYITFNYQLTEIEKKEQHKIMKKFAFKEEVKFMKLASVRHSASNKLIEFDNFLKNIPEQEKNYTLDRTIIFVPSIEFGKKLEKILFQHLPQLPYNTFNFKNKNLKGLKKFQNQQISILIHIAAKENKL